MSNESYEVNSKVHNLEDSQSFAEKRLGSSFDRWPNHISFIILTSLLSKYSEAAVWLFS